MKMSKNILILGSKPEADFNEFDIAYCANAASSFYNKQLLQKGGIVKSIISASELVENKRKDNIDKTIWLQNKLPKLIDNSKSKIYLINYNHFCEAVTILKKSSFNGELDMLNTYELNSLQKRITNYSEPIWTKFHRDVGVYELLSNIKHFLINKFYTLKDKSYLNSGLFRPSTGVVSLIIAIHENGLDASYEVSGIGIKGRGLYPDGQDNTWTPKGKLQAYHVYVDRIILETLVNSYEIFFRDKSLNYLNSKNGN